MLSHIFSLKTLTLMLQKLKQNLK